MTVTTSDKLKIVLELAQGPSTMPASTLKAVAMGLESLIPEVEALEKAKAPQDAVPSALDEMRKRQEELQTQIQEGVTRFKGDLARRLREAAQALNPED
jgi:hypothetical protein